MKIARILLYVLLALVVVFVGAALFQAATWHPQLNSAPVSEEFNDPVLPLWSIKLVDGLGTAKAPPYHGADIVVRDGIARFQISPDPNFGNESHKNLPGHPAAEAYNNVFAIGFPSFAPTRDRKVVVEFRMKVDKAYQGTTGFWLEDRDTFDESGVMRDPNGFPGAFGISFVSADSTPKVAGLKFEYTKYFIPLCIGDIKGIDPEVWNTYRIEWSKVFGFADWFKVYVDGKYQGSCFVPFIGFGKSEGQLWADNYWVKSLTDISFLNPNGVQGSEFDYVRIWTEK